MAANISHASRYKIDALDKPERSTLMKSMLLFTLALTLLTGCAALRTHPPVTGLIPCTYRFKMLSRPEDQTRVEAAIRSVAVGSITMSGTASYPEYRFRVAQLADLDTLHPQLLFTDSDGLFAKHRRQSLNLKAAGVEATFDSTDLTVQATTTLSFLVKPGSRLYYKHPGGHETDITAKVNAKGQVTFPTTIHEGQKYIFARAVKDRVTRYIRINIFTNQIEDISDRDYR